MSDQELPRLEIEDSTDDYTRMVVEPLKHGFGTTIGWVNEGVKEILGIYHKTLK